jgi:hypothetical protein
MANSPKRAGVLVSSNSVSRSFRVKVWLLWIVHPLRPPPARRRGRSVVHLASWFGRNVSCVFAQLGSYLGAFSCCCPLHFHCAFGFNAPKYTHALDCNTEQSQIPLTDNQFAQRTMVTHPYIIRTLLVKNIDRDKRLFAFNNRMSNWKTRARATRTRRHPAPKLPTQLHATRMVKRNAAHYQQNKEHTSVRLRTNNLIHTLSHQH